VHKVTEEMQEIWDHTDLQDIKVNMVIKDIKDLKVLVEVKVQQENKETLGHKERKVLKEKKDFQVIKELLVILDQKDLEDQQAQWEKNTIIESLLKLNELILALKFLSDTVTASKRIVYRDTEVANKLPSSE